MRSIPIRDRPKFGIVAESPLLYGSDGPIRPKRVIVFLAEAERSDTIAKITNRVWPNQDCFALYYPFLHRSFVSRRNSTAENHRLGPAPECLDVSRQPAGINQDIVIDPEDVIPFNNIDCPVQGIGLSGSRFKSRRTGKRPMYSLITSSV